MIQTKAELVEIISTRDEEGRAVKGEPTVLKTVYLGALIPRTHRNFPKEYGADVQADYGAYTFHEVKINDMLRINGRLYTVKESLDYPNRARLLLLGMM